MRLTLPVKIDVPVMLGRQGPHRLKHVALRIITLLSGGASVCTLTLRQAREPASEELWSR